MTPVAFLVKILTIFIFLFTVEIESCACLAMFWGFIGFLCLSSASIAIFIFFDVLSFFMVVVLVADLLCLAFTSF